MFEESVHENITKNTAIIEALVFINFAFYWLCIKFNRLFNPLLSCLHCIINLWLFHLLTLVV